MKLSSLPGWPGNKKVNYSDIHGLYQDPHAYGFNEALDACDRVLVIDEVELQDFIFKHTQDFDNCEVPLTTIESRKLAQFLSKNASKWVVLKEGV